MISGGGGGGGGEVDWACTVWSGLADPARVRRPYLPHRCPDTVRGSGLGNGFSVRRTLK